MLLQEKLDIKLADLENLKSLGAFVAVFYVSSWFQFPLASSKAAHNDLLFYKEILEF